MSDQLAVDWDFFIHAKWQFVLEKNWGYEFKSDGTNYHSQRNGNKLAVSARPLLAKEQIILVNRDPLLVWCGFDYQHCMMGIEGICFDEISVGIESIWSRTIVKNEHSGVMNYREKSEVLRKMESRSVWGKSRKEVIRRWEEIVDEYLKNHSITRSRRVDIHDSPVTMIDDGIFVPFERSKKKERPETCYICDRPATRGSGGVPVCGNC